MKEVLHHLISKTPYITCAIISGILAYNNNSNWFWFLIVTSLVALHSFETRKREPKN